MNHVEELLKKYRATASSMNDMEKAKLEKEIWEAVKATPGRPPVGRHRDPSASNTFPPREEWFRDNLGITKYDSGNRQHLLNGMPATQPLWDRVMSKKMLLETASGILKLARRLTVDEGLDLAQAVVCAIDEYDSRPYLCFVGGIPVRRGMPTKQARPTAPAKKATERRVRSSAKTEEGILLARLRGEITDFLHERAGNIEPILREQLIGEFEVAVKVVVEELRHKIARLTDDAADAMKAEQAVSLRRVSLACETLHMDPPTRGHPVDINKAKKQKKMLAREYHPDMHSGEVKLRMEEKFHSVLQAFSVIEQYNEQVSPTGKGDGSARERAEGGGHRG